MKIVATFPALSTETLEALAADMPELAKIKAVILASEREVIKKVLENARQKPQVPGKKLGAATSGDFPLRIGERGYSLIKVARAAEMDLSVIGQIQPYLVGHQIGQLVGAALETGGFLVSDRVVLEFEVSAIKTG